MHVDIYVYGSVWGMAGHKRKTEVTLVNYPKKNPLTNGEFGSNLAQNSQAYISRAALKISLKHCSRIRHNR